MESRIIEVKIFWSDKWEKYCVEVVKKFSDEDGGGTWSALIPGVSDNLHRAIVRAKEEITVTPARNMGVKK